MEIFTIMVGFTTARPIIPDQHFAQITLMADSLNEAMLIAAQIVATHSEMPTSTELIGVEI